MPAESYPRYSSRRSPPSNSGLASLAPTYPMIPHMPTAPSFRLTRPENTTSPAMRRSRHVAGKSAELLGHERGDPSTEAFGLLLRRSLCEDADNRLRTGRPHEHAAAA